MFCGFSPEEVRLLSFMAALSVVPFIAFYIIEKILRRK